MHELKQFLSELNITIAKQEGQELVCTCPWCDSPKLYVNVETGGWQCFHGCGQGYPYQLAAKITGKPARDVFEIVDRYGLRTPADEKPPKRVKKNISFLDGKLRPATDDEINALAAAKSLDPDALRVFAPRVHVDEPVAYLPVFDPADLTRPTGYLRCRLDGKPFDTGVKYPTLGNVGLFALPWLAGRTDETIIIAEAWRDMAAAVSLGYAATATWGAGPFYEEWLTVFKNRDVVVIHDEDIAGVGGTRAKTGKHSPGGAVKRAKLLHSVARSVRIARLPYEWREDKGEDLHDYIVRDGHDTLDALIEAAPEFVPPAEDNRLVLPDDHPDTIAEAFERQSQVKHRYHPHDGWSICKDGRYQKVDDKKQIARYISRFASQCWFTKNKQTQRVRLTSGRVNDIIQQLSFLDGVYLRPSQAAPYSLDGSVDPQNIIACQNCLVDRITRKTYPISDKFYTFNYLPYDYDADAISEKWGHFLVDVTDGDPELMRLLQTWCGYLLMPTTKYQKFLLCVGEGANGKFVFFDTVAAAVGKDNVSNVPLEAFSDPYKVFATYGKVVNMSNESTQTLEAAAESIIKEFVGGDKMLWEQKYRDAFSAYPTAKLMFATNILPTIRDPSDGIWRRMLYVPFDVQFPEDKQNRNLAAELQEPRELAGILNWMLEGMDMLEADGGFVIPQRCKERLQVYRDESNSARLFIAEHLEVDATGNCQIVKGNLYAAYQQWCKDNGYHAKGNARFGADIHRCFPYVQDSRPWVGMSKKTVYVGIRPQEGIDLGPDVVVQT